MKTDIPNYLKDKLLSTHGGYTRAEIELLGFAWPPHKGWKRIALKRLELEAEYRHNIKAKKKQRRAKRLELKGSRPAKFINESGLQNGFVVRKTGTGKAHILINGRTLCRRGMTDRTVTVSKAGEVPLCLTCLKLQKVDPDNDRFTEEEQKGFYYSWEWKKARFETIKKYGPVCMCCGSDYRIVVDHIKPRSKFPALELDRNNLQVLCNDCNRGKSNDDYTDFRPKDGAVSTNDYLELEHLSDIDNLH